MKKNTIIGNYNFIGICRTLLFLGIGLLALTCYFLSPLSFNIPITAYLQMGAAFFIGFLLRCVRRKLFFGGGISFHQSVSFEIVVQIKQALNPLLPVRVFEAEFIERETNLKSDRIGDWVKSRIISSYAVMTLAVAWVLYLYKTAIPSLVIVFAVASVIIMFFMFLSVNSGAFVLLMTILSGFAIWIFEGLLFVMALLLCGASAPDAWCIYLLFIFLLEISPIPFGLGLAELPLLFFRNGVLFILIMVFHILRFIPILILGYIYLPRYKFSFNDFYNSSLTAILHASHSASNFSFKQGHQDKLDLSIIIPAYNEELRLPGFLKDVLSYLDTSGILAEVIIVDDGSKDKTAEVVNKFIDKDNRVRLLIQDPNQGKGAAVKRGILEAAGKFAIYADADGATPISEIDKFLPYMMSNSEIIIGSRKAGSSEVDRSRKGVRALMGIFFYKIVNLFAVPGIQDTQCGFKMFRCDIGKKIFERAQENGWAFDVELLYLAQLFGYTIHEVPVNWHEVDGSKVNPLVDSMKMLVAIFRIRSVHGGFFNNA
jgi:dolichyl-phosphate beta-glucosyltransferase